MTKNKKYSTLPVAVPFEPAQACNCGIGYSKTASFGEGDTACRGSAGSHPHVCPVKFRLDKTGIVNTCTCCSTCEQSCSEYIKEYMDNNPWAESRFENRFKTANK